MTIRRNPLLCSLNPNKPGFRASPSVGFTPIKLFTALVNALFSACIQSGRLSLQKASARLTFDFSMDQNVRATGTVQGGTDLCIPQAERAGVRDESPKGRDAGFAKARFTTAATRRGTP